MTYQRLTPPRYRKVETEAWANQIAANFAAHWEDRPRLGLYCSSSSAIPDDTQTPLAYDVERYQVGDFWALGDPITMPIDGFYYVSVTADWDADTSGTRTLMVQTSAEEWTDVALPDPVTGYCTQTLSFAAFFAAGETIEVVAWQDSGSSLDVNAGSSAQADKQDFSALWIGDANYGVPSA